MVSYLIFLFLFQKNENYEAYQEEEFPKKISIFAILFQSFKF